MIPSPFSLSVCLSSALSLHFWHLTACTSSYFKSVTYSQIRFLGVNSRKVHSNLWSVCFHRLLIFFGSSLCNLEIKMWMTLDAVAVQLITWVHTHTHTKMQPPTHINVCVCMDTHARYADMKSQRDILFCINKLWHTTATYLAILWWNVYSWIWP